MPENDHVSGSYPIKFKPWTVPVHVLTEPDDFVPESMPTASVPPEILSRMCDRFRADVFRKAGKKDPRPPVNCR